MITGLKIPKLIRWILSVGIIFLLWMTLLRVVFYFSFNHAGNPLSALGSTFLLGLRFDVKMVCIFLELLLLLGAINFMDPFVHRQRRVIFFTIAAIACIGTAFIYTIDFAHYSYLNIRLSASVMNYLDDAKISLTLVWQNYPVLKMIFAILLISLIVWWLLVRSYRKILHTDDGSNKNRKWIWVLATAILLGMGIFGNFGQYNLRWSAAFSLGNDYRANLALNPFQSFFSSLKFRGTSFNMQEVRRAYNVLKPYYGFTGDSANLNYERTETVPASPATPNVVVVICESFSAYKSSMWGNPLNTTPFFQTTL